MPRITRKELKSDKFALEVEHSLTFFEEHQPEITRYGGAAVVVALLVFGFIVYQRHERGLREQALGRAIAVQETGVGPATPGQPSATFPTQQVKDDTAIKMFTDVKNKYSGSAEGEIALYYLGSIRADQGNWPEAEKALQEVAQKGDDKYASLAKLSLAQVYFAEGKTDQGEKTARDLMAHPTVFVSKDQATIVLARGLMKTKPAEARKLLDPLRQSTSAVSQVAITLSNELPPQ